MAHRIELSVDGRGQVQADFSGFLGSDCDEEADRLSKVLAALGVAVQVRVRESKPVERQAAEAGIDPAAVQGRPGAPGSLTRANGEPGDRA